MSDHDTPEVGSGQVADRPLVPYDPDDPDEAEFLGLDAPASPVPVQPADAGEGLSEAEREALNDWPSRPRLYAVVERILAARDAEHAAEMAVGREQWEAEVRRAESAEARLANVEAAVRATPSCGGYGAESDGCYVQDAVRAVRAAAKPTTTGGGS